MSTPTVTAEGIYTKYVDGLFEHQYEFIMGIINNYMSGLRSYVEMSDIEIMSTNSMNISEHVINKLRSNGFILTMYDNEGFNITFEKCRSVPTPAPRMTQIPPQFPSPESHQPVKIPAKISTIDFNNIYLNKDSFFYANNSVTANALALSFGLPPEDIRSKVFDNIVYKTSHEYQNHISTGLVGGQWIMATLSENGRSDLAFKLATNNAGDIFSLYLCPFLLELPPGLFSF